MHRHRRSLRYGPIGPRLSFVLILAALAAPAASAVAAPVDCNAYFKAALDTDFPFQWRGNRCEGFVETQAAQIVKSVKISSFGFGRLAEAGLQKISNKTPRALEVRGSLVVDEAYYRMVAKLDPGESIDWQLPLNVRTAAGYQPGRLTLVGQRPGAAEDALSPYTIGDAAELHMGVISTDTVFNALDIRIFDRNRQVICRDQKRFEGLVPKNEQVFVTVDLCGKLVADAARVSVTALLYNDGQVLHSRKDVVYLNR